MRTGLLFFGIVLLLISSLLTLARRQPAQAPWLFFSAEGEGGKHDIYRMRSDGSRLRNLTHQFGTDFYPQVSPNGRRLVFLSYRNANFEIYTMNVDGSNIKNLTQHPENDYAPQWSPDGAWILFTSSRNTPSAIYRMRSDGSELTNLSAVAEESNGRYAIDKAASWSPDGKWIVFASYRKGAGDIYKMQADGSGVHKLTSSSPMDTDTTWSADGEWIYLRSWLDGNSDIFRVKPDGSDLQNLTNHPAHDADYRWSPDGQWITFHSDREDAWDIYRMKPDGTQVEKLSPDDIIPYRSVASPIVDFAWRKIRMFLLAVLVIGVARYYPFYPKITLLGEGEFSPLFYPQRYR